MDEKLKRAIEEMAEGKEEGFNAVYSATYNHVYFRAKAYMKDEADAQDLTQIVYIEAYKNIKSLQNAESLFGWLDGICHNQGMKIFRKKKDVLPNVDEEGKDIFETLESNDITSLPELSTDKKETSRIIQEFIGELPEVQKAAVIAYYFDGFSVGEIAQMQDCSEGTVKSRLNYARKFLKDKVEGTEKRDGIRLHVVALPTLYYAIKLMSENTKLSAKAAEGIYVGSCAKVGLTPGAIALGNAGAGMSAKMAVSGAVKVAEAGSAVGANAAVASSGTSAGTGSGAAAGTAGAGIAGAAGTVAATGAGLSLGVKALIIAGAILVGAGAGAGATYYAVKQNAQEAEIVEDEGDVDSEVAAETTENSADSDVAGEVEENETKEVKPDEGDSEEAIHELQIPFTVTGTVIRNADIEEYASKYSQYSEQYGFMGNMPEYGIRFDEPVKLQVGDNVIEVPEAWLLSYMGQTDIEPLVGQKITTEGWMGHHLNVEKISDELYRSTNKDDRSYHYYPNGEYEYSFSDLIEGEEKNEKSEEYADVSLTEDEKIQIVDAIGFYSQDWLDAGNYVFCARLYAVYTLWNNPEAEKAFPWKKDDKLDVPFVKDFYNSLGIEIPGDYDFEDNGITADSDNLLGEGELPMDYYAYEGLDIKNNGDGTYTLSGQYSWRSLDDEPGGSVPMFPFTATAVKGGNPDIFGGLIIKDCSTFDYSKWKVNSSESSMNSELMASRAAEIIKQKQAEGIVYSYGDAPVYFVFDVTSDGIPEIILQEGTCEADYVMNIYTWVDAQSDWIKMGETQGDHVGNYWGKNSHDGFYGSSVHMGYEFVYDYDGKSNTSKQIYEGEVEWIDYPNGDSEIKTLYEPTDATLLTFYADTSASAIKTAIENAE